MSVFQQLLGFLNTLLSWCFTVEPWEQAIRVRCGKNVRLFPPGMYWKFPFFDVVYKQNVRRRVCGIPIQTLTARDGKALTITGSLGYKVADVLKLHLTLHDAEGSVQQEVLGIVADYVASQDTAQCTPALIIAYVRARLDFERYGLSDVEFFLSGYVCGVPTFRLLQDTMQAYGMGGSLSTQPPSNGPPR